MSKLPLISVVIICWNSRKDILELLSSIQQSDYPKMKLEVIVVDNASTDGSTEHIKKSFPRTKLITLSKNIGQAARNYALKKAKGEIIVNLDSDVTVNRDLFRKILQKFQSEKKIGVLGVKVLGKKDSKQQISYNSINLYTGVVKPMPSSIDTDKWTFLAGTIHVSPRSIYRKIGFYNPNHFYYGSDMDFCLRAKKQGYKIIYYPETSVFHGKSNTTADIPIEKKYKLYYRALFYNIYKHASLLQKISALFFQLAIIPIYLLITREKNTFPERLWGIYRNIKNSSKETKLISAILLFALILRIPALYLHDFWYDEAFTYHLARLPLIKLLQAVLTDNNPPLYYILIHYVLKLSSNEVILRIPSMVFNLITIYLIYSFFPKTKKHLALTASALFAFSPLSIYIATEARLHSLATALFLATTLAFFSFIKNPNKRNIFLLTLLSILSLLTQNYAALLYFPFFLIIVLRKNKNLLLKFSFVFLITTLIMSPWIIASMFQTHNTCSCPNTLLSLPSVFASNALAGVGPITLRFFSELPLVFVFFFSSLALTTFLFFIRGIPKRIDISIIFLIPLFILSIAGFFLPVFSPKAFATFSPFFCIILAFGLNSINISKWKLSFIFPFLFILVSLIQIRHPFFHGERLKIFHNTIIADHPNSLVAHTSLVSFYTLNYYSQNTSKHIVLTKNPLSPSTVNYIGGKQQAPPNEMENLWLLDSPKWVPNQEYSQVLKNLKQKFNFQPVLSKDNINLWYLEKK